MTRADAIADWLVGALVLALIVTPKLWLPPLLALAKGSVMVTDTKSPARKHAQTELHRLRHRRVEGQIRSAIADHPDWFRGMPSHGVQSIAKRIVGEIVAAKPCGGICERCAAGQCDVRILDDVPPQCASSSERGVAGITATLEASS